MLAQRELLDQLLGKDRDIVDDKKDRRQKHWKDSDVCPYYLAGFCPHDLFTNTKSDLGPCDKVHEDDLREQFQNEPAPVQARVEATFLRYLMKLCDDVDRRIRRGTSRLSQTVTPDQSDPQYRVRDERIAELNKKLAELVDQMEVLGEEGKVDESHALLEQMEALNAEKAQLTEEQEAGQRYIDSHEKQMGVCDVCGAFLTNSETEARVQSHLNGKQHVGFTEIREKIVELRARVDVSMASGRPERGGPVFQQQQSYPPSDRRRSGRSRSPAPSSRNGRRRSRSPNIYRDSRGGGGYNSRDRDNRGGYPPRGHGDRDRGGRPPRDRGGYDHREQRERPGDRRDDRRGSYRPRY